MTLQWRRQDIDSNGAHDAPGGRSLRRQLARAIHWQALPPPVRLAAILLALLALWHGGIGTWQARIETDLALYPTAAQLPPGGSVMIATAARLIERQTQQLAFTANDPAFYPTGLLVRTPAYQAHVVTMVAAAVAADAAAANSQLLTNAATLLASPPDHWWLRAATPPVGRPAERLYAEAIDGLAAYNRLQPGRDAAGNTRQTDTRQLPPAARRVLTALATQVERDAQSLDRARRHGTRRQRTVALAGARGTAYAAALLLRGLRQDQVAVIRLSGRAARWSEATDQLADAAQVAPLIIRKADLIEAGYAMLLAATALREISGASASPSLAQPETAP